MSTLRKQIQERIEEDGRSIRQLAKDAGLNEPTVNRYARGERELTGERLWLLIQALGGKITWKKKRN